MSDGIRNADKIHQIKTGVILRGFHYGNRFYPTTPFSTINKDAVEITDLILLKMYCYLGTLKDYKGKGSASQRFAAEIERVERFLKQYEPII